MLKILNFFKQNIFNSIVYYEISGFKKVIFYSESIHRNNIFIN